MLVLSLVVWLHVDIYLKYDMLGVISLPSTASLEFAYNCRRHYLVFILVQCLLIFLHLRKPLKTDTYLTGSDFSCSPIYSCFCWRMLSSFLLLTCFSSLPTVSVSLTAGERKNGLSPLPWASGPTRQCSLCAFLVCDEFVFPLTQLERLNILLHQC